MKSSISSEVSGTVPAVTEPAREPRLPFTERFQGVWIGIVLLIAIAVFTVAVPDLRFTNVTNLTNIALDSSEVLMMAVATTFVLIAGGIDLSIGSVLVLSSVVMALVMSQLSGTAAQVANYQYPNEALGIPVGVLAGLAVALLAGFINGVLIAFLRLPAFIVTLGTSGIALGAALVLTRGENAPYIPSDLQSRVGDAKIIGFLPLPVLMAFVLAAIGWVILSQTTFGIHTYAIGASAQAARRGGINVKRHLLLLYTFSGLCSGIAAFVDLARFTATSIEGHQSDNLQAIAAVVLGGTSLFGGAGGMIGTVIAVFFPSVLNNGLIQVGVQPFWQGIVLGVVLIGAVYSDVLRRRRRSGGTRDE